MTAFGSLKPSNPSYVKAGDNVTLKWNYTINPVHGSLGLAKFSNVTDGVNVAIATKFLDGGVTVAAGFQERFRADISDTLAQLTILTVQRSERGKYEIEITATNAVSITAAVELVVQCK